MSPCNFRPFPGNGAYGHWTCDLAKHHRGRHRFRNYTIARVPRIHRGLRAVGCMWWRRTRRTVAYTWKYHRRPRGPLPLPYRTIWDKAIWPTEYDPREVSE